MNKGKKKGRDLKNKGPDPPTLTQALIALSRTSPP